MGAIAEVRASCRPGLHGIANLRGCGGRVADCHYYAGRDKLLDESNRASALGSNRDHANVSAGRVLPAAELIPVRFANELLGVCAARPVFAREVWPFEVIAGNPLPQ